MVAQYKSYAKHLGEGKTFLVIAIVFSMAIRLIYFFLLDTPLATVPAGYIWDLLSPYLTIPLISFSLNCLLTGLIAFWIAHINSEHVFIRQRTLLPSAYIILLFSCSPKFIYLTGDFIGAIFFLYALGILFASYNIEYKQSASYKVSFIITLGSFFSPVLLFYIPFCWIALASMRSFNGKAFVVSLLSVVTLYFAAFSFYLFAGKMDIFFAPFLYLNINNLIAFPFLGFDSIQWIIIGIIAVLLIIIISDNYINRHKDKIRVRAYLSILDLFAVLALLFFLFLNMDSLTHLFVGLISIGLLLAHFFALLERKLTLYFFYLVLVLYILICFIPFLYL